MHAWGCVSEHCVQAIQCLYEKWPCVCLRECIFFSTICSARLFTPDSTCVLYTVYTSRSHRVFVCAHIWPSVCVHVCIKFGLGQLQLCQSELLQMLELPEEEEKAE